MYSVAIIAISLLSAAATNALPASSSSSSGYFPDIAELGWCLVPWHVSSCLAANGHAGDASAAAAETFPESLHNGQGDAFRHCYWNARMAIDIGVDDAKSIADNHEEGSDGPEEEKRMDYANNETGRGIGAGAQGGDNDAKFEDAKQKCRNAATDGTLVVLE